MKIQSVIAVVFSLILITGTVTPVVAVGSADVQPSREYTDATVPTTESLDHRTIAYEHLTQAPLPGKGKHRQLESQLSETFDSYAGPNRITTPVFKTDAKIAGQTQQKAPDVADNLAAADEALAQTAFADAVSVHERLSSDSNVEYDTKAVDHHLEQADKALTKGGSKPVARIQRSRRAWMHAQQALDIMDEATAPHVTITTREDPQHEAGYAYQLNGTVTDVRTFELQTVSVKFADGTSKTVELETQTSPFASGTFNTTLTLEKRVNEITVSATDSNVRLGTRDGSDEGAKDKNGRKGDSKKSTQSTPSTTGADTLLLDADLLPDYYEQSVTGTDPLAVDSDSSHTGANEAQNRVIDGFEDFDDDEVTTYVEYLHDIDPFDPDTDDDELTDRFELDYANLNPGVSDTDGDGTPDGADDNEPEGLTNVREQAFGTNPNDPDTDDDRLLDSYEADTTKTVPTKADSNSKRTSTNESANGILDGAEDFDNDTLETALEQNISTDPFDVDTDDDQLTDPFEYRFETIDPTTADTDGDGTPDTIEDPDGETLVNIDEQRNGTVPTDPDTDDDKLTDAYEIRTTGTVPVDADSDSSVTERSEANNGVNDGMEDFDGESLRTHVEQNLGTDPFDVDTDDDELTDAFEHRFDTIEPLLSDTDGDGLPDGQEDPDNESLVNVREQQYGTLPLDADTDDDNLTDKYEVDTVLTNPVVPDSDSEVTEPDEAGNAIIDGVEDFDNDGLPTALEFEAGTAPFDADSDDDGLLDGFEYEYDTLDPLNADTDGDGVSDAHEDPDGETLVNIDEQAASTNPLEADTDGDTLTDAFEVRHSLTLPTDVDSSSSATNVTEADNGIRDDKEDLENDTLSNAREQTLGTNPLSEDTDEDGLTDAFEVQTTETNPLNANSDSPLTETDEAANNVTDGLEDFDTDAVENHYEELFGTDPFDEDTDSDGLSDGIEFRYDFLDPAISDSDGDGVSDGQEDPDADDIVTKREITAGTNPILEDSDLDTLLDGEEIDRFGTDPLSSDTDIDGIEDGREIELGTDPLKSDSDGDGVSDNKEEYRISVSDESAGARIELTGDAQLGEGVEIEPNSRTIFDNNGLQHAKVSEIIGIEAEHRFDTATVTLRYNSTTIENETNLSIYRWDSNLQTFSRVKSSVHTANETVSAPVTVAGTYLVMDTGRWDALFDQEPEPSYDREFTKINETEVTCTNCQVKENTVLLGHGGTSGTSETTRTKSDGQISIFALPYCDIAPGPLCIPREDDGSGDDGGSDDSGGDDGSSGSGGGGGSSEPEDSDGDGVIDDSDLCPNVAGFESTGGCPDEDADGTRDGADECPTDSTTANKPCFVDGGTLSTITLPNAETIDAQIELDVRTSSDGDVTVKLIGEDGSVKVYDRSGRQRHEGWTTSVDVSRFAGQRVAVYAEVSGSETSVLYKGVRLAVDTDGDGLRDSTERQGVVLGDGTHVSTSPILADTDGDGLTDSYELRARTQRRGSSQSYYRYRSNPVLADTDRDGATDYAELIVWNLDSLDADTDDDGYTDLVDSRPTVEDTPPDTQGFSGGINYVQLAAKDDSKIQSVEITAYFGQEAVTAEPYEVTPSPTYNLYYLRVPRKTFDYPDYYYVNITDSNGNTVSYRQDKKGVGPLSSSQLSSVAVASTVGAKGRLLTDLPGLRTVGSRVSIVFAGAIFYNHATTTYEGDTTSGQTELSPVPASTTLDAYHAPGLPVDPILPSGEVYPSPLGDGHDRGFGWEYIKRTPGINDQDDIGEVLRVPSAIEESGEYTIVIGETDEGNEVSLWLLEGGENLFIVTATTSATNYRGDHIDIEDAVDKIVNRKNDWDHNQLGDTEGEVVNTINEILRHPSEVYEGTRQSDGATVTVYVKEMLLNGNAVIVFALVVNGKLITSFVPAGEAASGSSYQDAYSREEAIRYIVEEVLKTATGHDTIEKIEMFEEVIEQFDVGDEI